MASRNLSTAAMLQPQSGARGLRHLAGINMEHPGREYVRRFEDSFKLKGPSGEHGVFVMTPLAMSAWDFLERGSLFRVYDSESEERNNAYHLAAMTALLGPPPPEFLRRSTETSKYWNKHARSSNPP
ncbi:hypothetical protein TOPH_07965 [Tolypocladium ophioglossoides CBS 100239]|uniref:Uncharacterized protein n=1 Tax=Tolypocladium ophioglossoides (strain CBS 100239) TaxID=1163406 RepID=A0A0L0MZQ6_TOLOC|nr:hypothetical protein TOPH_07965 [Tolypocladium ophioglossoides CBS 100239]